MQAKSVAAEVASVEVASPEAPTLTSEGLARLRLVQ